MNLANLKAIFTIPKWAKFFISISIIIILLLLIAVLLINQITLSEINSAIENPPPPIQPRHILRIHEGYESYTN